MATIISKREIGRFRAIDGLRGWAATCVIFYHGILAFDPSLFQTALSPPAFTLDGYHLLAKLCLSVFNGEYAVSLFFIMSGFVLQRSLQNQVKLGPLAILEFCVKRVFRLIPALIASVALMYVIVQFITTIAGTPSRSILPYLQNMILYSNDAHPITWTIKVEVLAIPAIIVFSLLSRWLGIVGMVVAIVYSLAALQITELSIPLVHSSLLSFSVGMLVAIPMMSSMFANVTCAGAFVCLVLFLFVRFFGNYALFSTAIGQTVLGACLIGIAAYSQANPLKSFLENNISQFLGRISYSLYLNAAITGTVLAFILSLIITPNPSLALPCGLILGALGWVITVPIALASVKYIEEPFMKIGKVVTRWISEFLSEPGQVSVKHSLLR